MLVHAIDCDLNILGHDMHESTWISFYTLYTRTLYLVPLYMVMLPPFKVFHSIKFLHLLLLNPFYRTIIEVMAGLVKKT